ncbi:MULTISPECIES: hypothetical protein [Nitrosomonas]|uniref:Uncharacterized protein n=1 Tax=Nitrosomonas communis TaxID=44574 RepID=A0A0F7KHA1_9PROT|nr:MULTISPECIES: hypothetical protein [Nitrosomonas]AKH38222.1 hypothetical protein AAW31_11170 [Nitrosomonas communis]TYP80672.1 hypothetical protein BCL69_105518 [Nitrosomonas communis]UVS60196.1 hypothetical protein NX761_11795 [Nitrosomonas sp. PLL12]
MAGYSVEILKKALADMKRLTEQESLLKVKHLEDIALEARLADQLDRSDVDIKKAVKAAIKGEIDEVEANQKYSEAYATKDELNKVRQRLELVPQVQDELQREIRDLDRSITFYRRCLCDDIQKAIAGELAANNKKIIEKLLVAHAAIACSGYYTPNWQGLVASAFPAPSKPDIDAAIKKFKAEHDFW